MWSSIKSIIQPESLKEAYRLADSPGKVFFSGGTYLVADKDPQIHTLIDINHLLDDSLSSDQKNIKFGARATLQNIVNNPEINKNYTLHQCARWSCPSKNIRNQRTMGGEVARRRINSELYTYLHALNATLSIVTTSTKQTSIREWNGDGIITGIDIHIGNIDKTAVQRFALIPSAPAFVIVAGIRRGNDIDCSVGGKADQMSLLTVNLDEFTDKTIENFSNRDVEYFQSDHYGSLKYKRSLIQTGLKRVRNEL